jgi:hypothetical protein
VSQLASSLHHRNAVNRDGNPNRELVKDYGRALVGWTGSTSRSQPVRSSEFSSQTGPARPTTIRRLLDLIRHTARSVTVLGLDPRVDGVV